MLSQHESEILNGRDQRLSFSPDSALQSALRVANFQMKKDSIKRRSLGPGYEQLCFEMNPYGGTLHCGKSIERYLRSLIIDDILSGGGNVSTFLPRKF